MSIFLEKAEKIIKEQNFNVYRICEVKNGMSETIELCYANPCQDIYSVAKVFSLSAAMMLTDRGLLKLDDKVTDIFSDELPKNIDSRWFDVTLHHLVSHTAGFGCGQLDIDCQDSTQYPTTDYLNLLFTSDLNYTPGDAFSYSDAAFYMVSRIVSKKLGEPMDDFLWRELFVPCKVREAAWSKCPCGYPMGATGLYIRAEDMAKLGVIYLNSGVYDGKRIMSENAVKTVLDREYELSLSKCKRFYSKGGMRGSMLQIIPGKDRVVAWTACDDRDLSPLLELAADCD